jgi:hypothetical protein
MARLLSRKAVPRGKNGRGGEQKKGQHVHRCTTNSRLLLHFYCFRRPVFRSSTDSFFFLAVVIVDSTVVFVYPNTTVYSLSKTMHKKDFLTFCISLLSLSLVYPSWRISHFFVRGHDDDDDDGTHNSSSSSLFASPFCIVRIFHSPCFKQITL